MMTNLIVHFLSATLAASILTTILLITQHRHYFDQLRNAFVDSVRRRNAASAEGTGAANTNADENGGSEHRYEAEEGTFAVGFFHPRCSAGGGGERVLWKIIEALGEMKEEAVTNCGLFEKKGGDSADSAAAAADAVGEEVLRNCRNLSVVIYTVDEPREGYERDLMKHVQDRFSIIPSPNLEIHFVHLHNEKHFLRKSKRLTLLAESYGTIRLAYAALDKVTPHIFVDTTGCAFTFLVAKVLAGCRVGTYVHYPTISTDMLSLVWERRPSYNNSASISTNPIVTYTKLLYYSLFAILYGLVGSLADLVTVNSSWTKGHIQYLWRLAGDIHVVFPPVDTKSLDALPLNDPPRENLILSIGQFRPEKDHALQLKSLALLFERHGEEMKGYNPKLVLVGSCRGDDDRERVDQLQKLARELQIRDSVEFVLNQPYPVLKDYLGRASVGIHTMWNEHFGIGVVEMMAAGLVTVAHDSGGPKSDIIQRVWDLQDFVHGGQNQPATGCLASSAEEYAEAIYQVVRRGSASKEVMAIRQSGRKAAERFSDEVFMAALKETVLASSLLK